jgi:hypothetical protein
MKWRNAGEGPGKRERLGAGRFCGSERQERCKPLELGLLGLTFKTQQIAARGVELSEETALWLPFWDLAERALFHS